MNNNGIILNNLFLKSETIEIGKKCLIIQNKNGKYCVPIKENISVGDKCLIIQNGNEKYCIPIS